MPPVEFSKLRKARKKTHLEVRRSRGNDWCHRKNLGSRVKDLFRKGQIPAAKPLQNHPAPSSVSAVFDSSVIAEQWGRVSTFKICRSQLRFGRAEHGLDPTDPVPDRRRPDRAREALLPPSAISVQQPDGGPSPRAHRGRPSRRRRSARHPRAIALQVVAPHSWPEISPRPLRQDSSSRPSE